MIKELIKAFMLDSFTIHIWGLFLGAFIICAFSYYLGLSDGKKEILEDILKLKIKANKKDENDL